MDLLQQLQWRYAVKLFDGNRRTSDEDIETLVAATHLAPSAAGLQPYKLVLVQNRELLAKLADHSMMNKDKINKITAVQYFKVTSEKKRAQRAPKYAANVNMIEMVTPTV